MLKRQRARRLLHQKNGVVVRQVVGHGRLIGEHASRQLDELYQALHWYVNCFQPRVLLVSKQIEGRKIHRIYDAAKTPLQRVLLSGALSLSEQQELRAIGKAFDPLRLFQQVEQLQQATFRCEAGSSSASQLAPSLISFDPLACAAERVQQEGKALDAFLAEEPGRMGVLNWRRTSNDPFAGQWEQILTWVQANPTRSSGDILRELQSLFPGCYACSHLRTLQRGMRKIRTQVLLTHEAGSAEGRQENLLIPAGPKAASPEPESLDTSPVPVCERTPSPGSTHTCSFDQHHVAEELSSRAGRKTRGSVPDGSTSSKSEAVQIVRRPPTVSSQSAHQASSQEKGQRLTTERAIQEYLQAHRTVGHRPKTLEWHQMALGHLHHYLQAEGHFLVNHMTETTIRNWLASLAQTPTTRGSPRSISTIETYARSARAFCGWLVERGTLLCSPMSEQVFPRTCVPLPHLVSLVPFEHAVRAGFSQKAKAPSAKRLAARDQALLWVFFDTGITVSEACALRVADLDPQTGRLRVRGKGGKERQMALGSTCLSHLRAYLRHMDQVTRSGLTSRQAGGDPLFGSEGKQPLTRNGVTMVFARFRKRAGISEMAISPQILRHSFALRYLQTGGNPQGLQELLGYEGMAPVRQYLRWSDQVLRDRMPKETEAG